ncbi:B3/4 domain-containing protein [candidate division KSB1 bacterium]
MFFKVDKAIFQNFPGLVIGVVAAKDIDNSQDSGAASFLKNQVKIIRKEWSYERIESDLRIFSWREAYRSFKAKPKKYKCSVENMYTMILNGLELHSINNIVDIYNAVSLKHNIPAGGDDIDKIEGDILLTYAEGSERFIPLNGIHSIFPKPGEVIYRDAEDVLCRRWNWRECEKSKMTEKSKNICLVVEGLPPVTREEVEQITTELAGEIKRFCGGSTAVHFVDSENPSVQI